MIIRHFLCGYAIWRQENVPACSIELLVKVYSESSVVLNQGFNVRLTFRRWRHGREGQDYQ